MANSEKQPWMKFFTRDWMADEALSSCSLGAQGLWMRMLCLMHRAAPQGHLLINGKRPTDDRLAASLGVPVEILRGLLIELREAGVFSVTNGGVIYCRRMVRDSAISEKRSKAVQKRWKKAAVAPVAEESSSRVEGELRGSSGEVGFAQESENPADFGVCINKTDTQKPEARSHITESSAASESEAARKNAEPAAAAEPPDYAFFDSVAEALGTSKVKSSHWAFVGGHPRDWDATGLSRTEILRFAQARGARLRERRESPPNSPAWFTKVLREEAGKHARRPSQAQAAAAVAPEDRAAARKSREDREAEKARIQREEHAAAMARLQAKKGGADFPNRREFVH